MFTAPLPIPEISLLSTEIPRGGTKGKRREYEDSPSAIITIGLLLLIDNLYLQKKKAISNIVKKSPIYYSNDYIQ